MHFVFVNLALLRTSQNQEFHRSSISRPPVQPVLRLSKYHDVAHSSPVESGICVFPGLQLSQPCLPLTGHAAPVYDGPWLQRQTLLLFTTTHSSPDDVYPELQLLQPFAPLTGHSEPEYACPLAQTH